MAPKLSHARPLASLGNTAEFSYANGPENDEIPELLFPLLPEKKNIKLIHAVFKDETARSHKRRADIANDASETPAKYRFIAKKKAEVLPKNPQ